MVNKAYNIDTNGWSQALKNKYKEDLILNLKQDRVPNVNNVANCIVKNSVSKYSYSQLQQVGNNSDVGDFTNDIYENCKKNTWYEFQKKHLRGIQVSYSQQTNNTVSVVLLVSVLIAATAFIFFLKFKK